MAARKTPSPPAPFANSETQPVTMDIPLLQLERIKLKDLKPNGMLSVEPSPFNTLRERRVSARAAIETKEEVNAVDHNITPRSTASSTVDIDVSFT